MSEDKPEESLRLTRDEKYSPLWVKIKTDYVEKRIALLSRQLENDLGNKKTTRLRGRIAELRDLLDLETDPAISDIDV